jgi:hypothetical protein
MSQRHFKRHRGPLSKNRKRLCKDMNYILPTWALEVDSMFCEFIETCLRNGDTKEEILDKVEEWECGM